jgi:hypothetical protein
MIKISELLKRRLGVSSSEFGNDWYRVHASLVMSIPENKRHEQLRSRNGNTERWSGRTSFASSIGKRAARWWQKNSRSISATHTR